ncbi:MAG: RNA polymerase sigma factor [Thermoguttaceae bacterium]|nr:RNA polymerase sigma factor [Thermoguttaceae bacterium]
MNGLMEKTSVQYTCWTDEDLFLEYRMTENRDLFEVLVQRYETELFRFLYKKVGNREAAEDVFQLAFMLVHEKRDAFEEGRRFRPWLYRIATNRAIDYLRMNKRHLAVSLDSPISGETESDTIGELVPDAQTRPYDSIEREEEIALVRDAIRHLPENYRAVLEMVCLNGMSYQAAADELGIPLKTVSSRIAGAKKRLAVVLSVRSRRLEN